MHWFEREIFAIYTKNEIDYKMYSEQCARYMYISLYINPIILDVDIEKLLMGKTVRHDVMIRIMKESWTSVWT